MQNRKRPKIEMSFAQKLKRNFLASTLLPFVVISLLISLFYNWMYDRNVRSLTSNYITAIARNIDVYFSELEQITFSPYYNQDVIGYLNLLHRNQTLDFAQRSAAVGKIQDLLSFLRFSREDIQSLVLVTRDSCLYYTSDMLQVEVVENFDFGGQGWYRQSEAAKGEVVFVPIHTQGYFTPAPTEQVFGVARAIVDIYTRETLAVIKIDANNQVLDLILNDTTFTVSGNVYLTDSSGSVIYAKDGAVAPEQLYPPQAGVEISTYNGPMTMQMVKPLQNGWSLHVLLDKREMRLNTIVIFIVAGSLYLLGTLLSFYFYNRSSRRLIAVIGGIKDTLLAFEQGDFAVRCQGEQAQEFRVLCDSINHMIVEFDNKIQQEYISTIRRKDAELRALKSQIEPHFLFNTLNSLIALSQNPTHQEQLLLEQSIFSLSHLLRYALDKQEEVELSDELKMLESYCNLQALRFQERFAYHIENRAQGDWGIPRLGLQPFVENAIIHGIEPMDRCCVLRILVEYDPRRDALEITIEDDGAGYDLQVGMGGGIGMTNSLERFRIYYPATTLDIASRRNEGCSVKLTIPHPIAIHL